jgi:hypothetical protein
MRNTICEAFHTVNTKGLGIPEDIAIMAAGAILST